MGRAATKAELIQSADSQYEKLWALISSMTPEEIAAELDYGGHSVKKEAHWDRDKNLRDMLTHLYEWHQLLLNWGNANLAGDPQPFLPPPYTWKTYGRMNAGFWQRHQTTSYEKAVTMLNDSHRQVMAFIESFTDSELFEKQHFAWTGATSLGAYCVSATASHYDWAIKKIKAYLKHSRSKT